jgi:hypothetical protein
VATACNYVIGVGRLAAVGVSDFELIELHPFGAFEALFAGGPPT